MAVVALLCSLTVSAHDFEVDGIYYNLASVSDLVVQVAFEGEKYNTSNEYSGSVVIPETVAYNGNSYSVIGIHREAFSGCSGLTSIYVLNETPISVKSDILGNYDTTLYVPQGELEVYKAAEGWGYFANIVEFDPTGIEDVTEDAPAFKVTAGGIQMTAAEGKAVAVYSAGGALVEKIAVYEGEEIALDKGVYIIRVGEKAVKVKL